MIWTLLFLLFYANVGTLVGAKLYGSMHEPKVIHSSRYYDYSGHSNCMCAMGSFVAGLCWPVGLWLLVGRTVVQRDQAKLRKRSEDEKELEQLRAQAMEELSFASPTEPKYLACDKWDIALNQSMARYEITPRGRA